MKKSVAIAIRSLLLAIMFNAISRAQIPEGDLSYLTPETLPPIKLVVEAALNALPNSLGELKDYDRRMRLSALAPNLQVRWRTFEGPSRRFEQADLVTTRNTRSSNTSENRQSRVSADPLDSFIQDTENDASGNQLFSETRYGVPYALDDAEVWRQEYAVQATWRLNDLFYHPDELKVTAANRVIAGYRVQHMEKVVPLYRTFANTVAQLARTPDNRQLYENAEDRLIILDNLTDNFISSYAKSRHKELNGAPVETRQPVRKGDAVKASEPPKPIESQSGVTRSPLTEEEAISLMETGSRTPGVMDAFFREERDATDASIDTSIPGDGLDPRMRTSSGERGEWEDDDDDMGAIVDAIAEDAPFEMTAPVIVEEDSDN